MARTPDDTRTERKTRLSRRRVFLVLTIALATILIATLSWRLWATQGYRAAEGIYLADGGQSFIQIEAGHLGALHVTAGRIYATRFPEAFGDKVKDDPAPKITAKFRHGSLTIFQKEKFPFAPAALQRTHHFGLAPDPKGNWTLKEADYQLQVRLEIWDFLAEQLSGPYSWMYEVLRSLVPLPSFPFWKEQMCRSTLPTDASPLHSYLHRVDDKRLIEYFDMRRRGEAPAECLALMRAICADHPNDRFLMPHLVELQALTGNEGEARAVLTKWRQEYAAQAGPILSAIADRAWQAIQRTEWQRNYPAFPNYKNIFPDPDRPAPPFPAAYSPDIKGHMQILRDRARIPILRFMPNPIVLTSQELMRGMSNTEYLNYLQIQVTVKSAQTMACFAMLKGYHQDALALLIGTYRLGQDLNADSELLLPRLIGMAVRRLACRGFALLALNALTTEEELAYCIDTLDRLATTPGQTTTGTAMLCEWFPLQTLMVQSHTHTDYMYINVDEVIFRQRLADAQMALVRAAARARLHYVRHGNLPTSREELADLFETDPPRDPFAPKLTISCKATSVGCVVYSLGPDGTEQNATVEFSSSDNMTDPGDVCLHVHREPIYPFPPGGVRASTALDVLRSFPHGLPNDPFGPNRSSPLSILDATTTTPIVVFSVGPQKAPPAGAHGRLQKPADEQSQPVFRRAFTEPAPPGSYTLQPTYDPTNGPTSSGNLFIEISRP